jgi:hypothetical protein
MDFDELNKLDKPYKDRAIPYDKYFGDMDLSDEQKQERISFSEKTEDMLLFIFALLVVMRDYNMTDYESVKQQLIAQYTVVISQFATIDDYLTDYVESFASDFIETTGENIDIEWFLSDDRAMFDAENEANSVLNYRDYVNAIASGKTRKEWVTFHDSRVRKTHRAVDGKIIPINGTFEVGNSLMRFAKDTMYNPNASELVN